MSEKNSSDSIAVYLAFAVIMALATMFMIIVALFAFATLILSAICLYAAVTKKSAHLGPFEITPSESEAFLARGFFGALAAPVFAAFTAMLFQAPYDPSWNAYLVLAGYCLGSLGIEIAMAHHADKQQQEVLPPVATNAPDIELKPATQHETRPFQFASWDDEEQAR